MNSRRWAPTLTVIFIVICVFLLLEYPQIAATSHVRWEARKRPQMWLLPQPLDSKAIVESTGRRFSYLGYEFESPWTEVLKERKFESLVILNFTNGRWITMFSLGGENELEAMKKAAAERRERIEDLFGKETTRSRYALRRRTLCMTPRDVNMLTSRQQAVANSILISIKGIELSRIKGGLFSFETDWTRGFQEGSPDRDKALIIDAFDSQDNRIQLIVGGGEGVSNPSQAEVNRIIYTLRPVASFPAQ